MRGIMRTFPRERRPEPQIYRVPSVAGPRYIRALEVNPGLLVHPDVMLPSASRAGLQEDDADCLWSLTHKDSGLAIVHSVIKRSYVLRAARDLSYIRESDAEYHWMMLDHDWMLYFAIARHYLPLEPEWPKGLTTLMEEIRAKRSGDPAPAAAPAPDMAAV